MRNVTFNADERPIEAARKRGIAADIVTQSIDRGTGAISYLVAQETLNVLTHKPNATPTAAQRLNNLLSPPGYGSLDQRGNASPSASGTA